MWNTFGSTQNYLKKKLSTGKFVNHNLNIDNNKIAISKTTDNYLSFFGRTNKILGTT